MHRADSCKSQKLVIRWAHIKALTWQLLAAPVGEEGSFWGRVRRQKLGDDGGGQGGELRGPQALAHWGWGGQAPEHPAVQRVQGGTRRIGLDLGPERHVVELLQVPPHATLHRGGHRSKSGLLAVCLYNLALRVRVHVCNYSWGNP